MLDGNRHICKRDVDTPESLKLRLEREKKAGLRRGIIAIRRHRVLSHRFEIITTVARLSRRSLTMKRTVIIALIAAMMLNCRVAVAQTDQESANFMLPACRAVADFSSYEAPKGDPYFMGICTGIIDTIGLMGVAFHRVCLPNGVTTRQAVAVVVQYIDKRPARMHEAFKILAIEALAAAWPCKK
jgi:Rap1a immunity proteins